MDEMTSNVKAILPLLDEAISSQQALSAQVLELVKAPPGPYALFHHMAHLIERLRDVRVVLVRLGKQRWELSSLYQREDQMAPGLRGFGKEVPAELVPLYVRRDELTAQMKVDFESLYVFANLALDQWAHTIAYLTGGQNPEATSFHALTMELQSSTCRSALEPIRQTHLRDVVWLFFQIRSYRNIFVEHVRRPWQRGTTASLIGEDFSLFTPTPPGWLEAQEVVDALKGIEQFAPAWLRRMRDDYWEKKNARRILERAFEHIDEIERQGDRERVWNAWKLVGGSTVSFDRIADRFARFMVGSTSTVAGIVQANPTIVNIGPPTSRPPATTSSS